MTKNEIKVGARVRFNGRRGQVTGVVVRLKTIERGRKFAKFGLPSIQHQVAEVMPEGESKGLWSVPFRMLTVLGNVASATVHAAQVEAMDLKEKRRSSEFARKQARQNIASENGLFDLKVGAAIEVQYKGGVWMTRYFLKHTASGTIGYTSLPYNRALAQQDALDTLLDGNGLFGKKDSQHVRFTPAQFVRIPAAK